MKISHRAFHLLRLVARAIVCVAVTLPAFAKPVPDNLGNGLDKLVESNLILQGRMAAPPIDKSTPATGSVTVAGKPVSTFDGYATQQAANYARAAIVDAISNRFMVDIVLGGKVPFEQVKQALSDRFASLQITAVDAKYRGTGIIEGYISIDDVPALAQTTGVRSVHLSIKPHHSRRLRPADATATPAPLVKLGTAFDQGVTQHRVDKINKLYNPSAPVDYEGTGMSIGFLSDSFNTSGTGSATTDVATKDLPGAGNPINTQPVVVLEEGPSGATDEGRGMVQIGYKMAPKARLAFATADTGEVGFANNIRALAGLTGYTKPPAFQQGFAADVICDDVGYFDEPFFQTGIIGDGIDDVYAFGVSYFSSAANDIGINGYDSDLRIVPNGGTGLVAATNPALKNTNINLATVPTNLYTGGFHNFDPSGDPNKQDVAQTVNVPNSAVLAQYVLTNYFLVFQWDDPYDASDPVLGPLIYHNTGNIDGTTTMSVTYDNTSTPPLPPFNAGTEYVITEKATSGNFDGIVSVIDPNGNTVLTQDTGTDEVVVFFPSISGQYKIKVDHFASTTGSFTLDVNTANGTALVTTDLNLLVFDTAGNYVASKSLTSNNIASNRPIDVESIMADNSSQLQFVIARSNTPSGPNAATHVRWVMPGNGIPNLGPNEYFTYNSPTTGGHAIAAGCNGTAAYSVFRPSIPEYFTSPGPGTIYFDKNNNRLNPPEIRQQPSIAAADGGNTSFFGSDSGSDADSNPNFFGTSAAAPHAASIAALVLQAHGGRHSVTPAQMTAILHGSTFQHDLDPLTATGVAQTATGGTVTVSIHSDNEANGGLLSGIGIVAVPNPSAPGSTGTGENDPNSISVGYSGPGHIATLTFNPNGLASEGGNVTGGANGVDATNTYFSNLFPGVAFLPGNVPFTVGTSLPNSLSATDVVATPSNQAGSPSNPGTAYWTLGLQFPTGNFANGKVLHFTIGRGEQHASDNTTLDDASGDIWGGGVLIPEGTLLPNGMKFSGTMDDGSPFSGRIVNQIGHGYTPLDGYGFINAEAAVGTPLPPPVQFTAVSRKVHGGTTAFDIPLPADGSGVECRSGGASGNYQVVFVFPNPLSSVGGAAITSGAGAVGTRTMQNGNTEYVVNLTNVTNAQKSTVTLTNVIDTAGNSSASITAILGVLVGDVNLSRQVDSGDVLLVQKQNGQAIPPNGLADFHRDLNQNGVIDSGDVLIAQKNNPNALAP